MAGQFVISCRKSSKNDANHSEPNRHFVANRTAQVNQIRGLLGEFGLVVPKGVARLRREFRGGNA